MKLQLHIFLWSLVAYILSWFFFLAFVNESRAEWSSWAYHGWVYGKFALPTIVMIVSTFSAVLTSPSNLPKRKMWIAWGVVTTPAIAFLSGDFWGLYLVQDDAPMGIFPDMNAVFCAIVAGFLFGCIFAGMCILEKFTKNGKRGQQGQPGNPR